MKLWLSPHPDDETLFGAFTLMKEKPLVVIVTDSYVQQNRGENITPQQRFQESVNAMKVLGCSIMRLGVRDDIANPMAIVEKLALFKNFETVYAPAIQGGNPVHDMVAVAAKEVFKNNLQQYSTYARGQWATDGKTPIEGDHELKAKALNCYVSQINLPATRGHFEAVKGKPEWYI